MTLIVYGLLYYGHENSEPWIEKLPQVTNLVLYELSSQIKCYTSIKNNWIKLVGMIVLKSTNKICRDNVSHLLYIPTLAFLVYHDQRIPILIAMTFEVGTYIIDVHQPDSARIPFEVFLTSC